MRRGWLAAAVVLLPLSAMARDGSSAGYVPGDRAAGMGGAYAALADDGDAAFYNPAGLSRLGGDRISANFSAFSLMSERSSRYFAFENGPVSALRSLVFRPIPASISYAVPLPFDSPVPQGLGFAVVVPDYDRVLATVSEDGGAYQARVAVEESTIWAGPAYGVALSDRMSLGLSVFGLYHDLASLEIASARGAGAVVSRTEQVQAYVLGLTAMLGAQVRVGDRFVLGATIRAPSAHLWGTADGLSLASGTQGFVDRLEATKLDSDFRVPAQVTLAVAYRGRVAVDLDVSWTARTAYDSIAGAPLVPRDLDGTVRPERAVDLSRRVEREAVLNARLGAEMHVTPSMPLRVGFFTDRAVARREVVAQGRASSFERYGVTLALGLAGKESVTSVGLTGTTATGLGSGTRLDLATATVQRRVVDTASSSLILFVSGSSDL